MYRDIRAEDNQNISRYVAQQWATEAEKSLIVALCYSATTFALCLIPWYIFTAAWWWMFLFILFAIAMFFASRAGWLTQEERNVERIIADNESLEKENESLKTEIKSLQKTNAKLKEQLLQAQRYSNQKPTKVRVAETEPVKPAPRKILPKNCHAALAIHQAWINDIGLGKNINREFLMKNCSLTRDEVEEGWRLLNLLGYAQKEDNRDNAKWIVTNEDDHSLGVDIDNHITSASPGMVHNI